MEGGPLPWEVIGKPMKEALDRTQGPGWTQPGRFGKLQNPRQRHCRVKTWRQLQGKAPRRPLMSNVLIEYSWSRGCGALIRVLTVCPQMRSFRTIPSLVPNENSQALPQSWLQNSGSGAQHSVFPQVLHVILTHAQVARPLQQPGTRTGWSQVNLPSRTHLEWDCR